jgi:hypothetical protein
MRRNDMNTKIISTNTLKILLASVLALVLGTIGCSGGASNPVTGDTGLEISNYNSKAEAEFLTARGERDVQIVWTSEDEELLEPNDDTGDAIVVQHLDFYQGHVDQDTDQNDYYKIITFAPALDLYIKLGWLGDAWLNVYLYNSGMEPVQYLNGDTGGPKTLYIEDLAPGVYYARVKAFEGTADYGIKFAGGTQVDETDNDDALTTNLSFDEDPDGNKVYSIVDSGEDQNDYIKVILDEDNTRIQASLDWIATGTADLNLYLYDEDLNPIVFSNGGAKPEAISSGFLSSGTYFLRIKAQSGHAIYGLSVDFKPLLTLPPWFHDQFKDLIIIPIPDPDPDPWFDFDFKGLGDGRIMPPQVLPQSIFEDIEMPDLPEFGY